MKFAALLALFGVSSASENVALPTYKVNTSYYCQNLMYHSSIELSQAMQSLPHDYQSQLAGVRTAQFLGGFQQLCSQTQTSFTCSNYAESVLRSRYNSAKSALNSCHTYQCRRLERELKEYFTNLDRCTSKLGVKYSQLVKVTVPTLKGQQEIQQEVMEIQMDIRNIQQSPEAFEIMQDIQRWQLSPEAQNFKNELKSFENSPEGARLGKEIQEALDALDKNTHEIPNGIEIDNDAIPQIQKEFMDVQREMNSLDNSNAANRLGDAAEKAFQQADFQSALRKLDQLGESELGKELEDDLDDLDEKLDKYVVVEDVPQH